MVMRNAVSLASKCSTCHHIVLCRFASIPFRPATNPKLIPSRIRAFTTSNPRRSDFAQQGSIQAANEGVQEAFDGTCSTPEEDAREPTSSLPWYLQVEIPRREQRSLSERQKLPELPQDPPPLLLPILQHINLDLGLDDLYLFDLRKLDPPPTLGANLLMILGTARSEKHLHVSADRFCRWLRSTHRLSPQADGLMGRGELKLKLRRKARRSRLLSTVGSSDRINQDDGLSTGWICVNVGVIEVGEGAPEFRREADDFVGFGEQERGARVVIQMLTQEKREELDLEELWGNVLERQRRRSEKSSASLEDPTAGQEVGHNSWHQQRLSSNLSTIVLSDHHKLLRRDTQQKREFHNVGRYFGSDHTNRDFDSAIPKISLDSGSSRFVPKFNAQPSREKGERVNVGTWAHDSEFETNGSRIFNTAELPRLRAHLKYLYSLPREDAVEALGNGVEDIDSTPFLASLHRSVDLSPKPHDWDRRIIIACYAIEISHPKYNKRNLMALFNETRASIIHIHRSTFVQVINTLLSSPKNPEADSTESFIHAHEIHEVIKLLEEMVSRGYQPYDEKILLPLYAAVARVNVSESKSPVHLRSDANARLRLLLDQRGFEYIDTKTHLDMLNAFADGDNWNGFWAHWRGIAKRMQPKSKELYSLMFHRVAQTVHQRNCMDALSNWLPEMEQEEPSIDLGDVAKAVMECLRVAEPDVEDEFIHGIIHPEKKETEWVRLWKRCDESIRDRSKNS